MSNINLGAWENFTNQIKNHIQTDDINNFIYWPIIKHTMIAGVDLTEFEELQKSKNWSKWETKLDETILKPNSHYLFESSSTNNIHHAYSLNIMMEYFNFDLNEFDSVVEFGGGYGNTCRLFKKWGHSGEYYIYDIPELTKIQKHYLTLNNLFDNIIYLNNNDSIKNIIGNSLFLGLWSITEVPVYERDNLLKNLNFFECSNIFIAMGGMFYNEDNLGWLNKEIIPKLKSLGFVYDLVPIKHGNNMFYFMAKKQN